MTRTNQGEVYHHMFEELRHLFHLTFVFRWSKRSACLLPVRESISALVAEQVAPCAMDRSSNVFWRDDEIIVDRDGIPHFTGAKPELMREYRKRVLFAYTMLEGDGDTEEKERRDLAKKQKSFAKKLLNGLRNEAWRCCQDLMSDIEALQKPDGYKEIFRCLQSIEKVTVVKKTEQFDKFFERGFRKRGQALDSYVRQRRQDWAELKELDDATSMSEDLLAYFILKHCNLSREDRRHILLNNNSEYTLEGIEIEEAMKVSFFDIHERERQVKPSWEKPSKGHGKHRKAHAHFVDDQGAQESDGYDQLDAYEVEEYEVSADAPGFTEPDAEAAAFEAGEDQQSDIGASDDDEVYEAYATYKESRKKLKDLQKSRGFFRGDLSAEDRSKAIAKEKERTRCSACDRLGHWAGDKECPKTGRGSGPNKKGKGKGKKKGDRGSKAYAVFEEPLFFTLDDIDEDDAQAFMISSDRSQQMDQDAGYTSSDERRKKRISERFPMTAPAAGSESGYTYVTSVVGDEPWERVDDSATAALSVEQQDAAFRDREVQRNAQMPATVENAEVQVVKVLNLKVLKPKLEDMKVRQLQEECDRWKIQTGGNKTDLIKRLETLFDGHPVARKGCTRKFVVLEELSENELQQKGAPPKSAKTPGASSSASQDAVKTSGLQAKAKAKAKASVSHSYLSSGEYGGPADEDEAEALRQRSSHLSMSPGSSETPSTPDERFFRSSTIREKAQIVVQDMEQKGFIGSPTSSTPGPIREKVYLDVGDFAGHSLPNVQLPNGCATQSQDWTPIYRMLDVRKDRMPIHPGL